MSALRNDMAALRNSADASLRKAPECLRMRMLQLYDLLIHSHVKRLDYGQIVHCGMYSSDVSKQKAVMSVMSGMSASRRL